MVNTTEITPSPCLQPFIQRFAYREFDTMGMSLTRPLPAMTEFLITFNLSAQPVSYQSPKEKAANRDIDGAVDSNSVLITTNSTINGINDHFNGVLVFQGYYRLFSIQFRPSGFYRIFGLPGVLLTNQIENGPDVFSSGMELLYERLQESENAYTMARYSEEYLMGQLLKSKAKDPYDCMQHISNLLFSSTDNLRIEKLAYDANMSIKTFERKFTEQVGVSPKLFVRMIRFNKALSLKVSHSKKSWTSIAHMCGYFDQMHLIKEFKLFSGETPSHFFKDTPPPEEYLVKEQQRK